MKHYFSIKASFRSHDRLSSKLFLKRLAKELPEVIGTALFSLDVYITCFQVKRSPETKIFKLVVFITNTIKWPSLLVQKSSFRFLKPPKLCRKPSIITYYGIRISTELLLFHKPKKSMILMISALYILTLGSIMQIKDITQKHWENKKRSKSLLEYLLVLSLAKLNYII